MIHSDFQPDPGSNSLWITALGGARGVIHSNFQPESGGNSPWITAVGRAGG
jgi:hypothetical protein